MLEKHLKHSCWPTEALIFGLLVLFRREQPLLALLDGVAGRQSMTRCQFMRTERAPNDEAQ